MTIAINSTHFISSAGNDFFCDYFVQFAATKPEHQFVLIIPASVVERPITSKNILQVISSPLANNPLMWKIWINYTLPAIARKYKADVIINTGGIGSLRTRIPQWLFISDLSFLTLPHFFQKKEACFLKKNMPAFLNKATAIITTADFLTNEILQQYSIDKEKINRFQLSAGDQYQPIPWEEKQAIKEKYADGKEFFLFAGDIHPRNNLLNLLKAFSFFKKRQKSNMQLVIATKAVSSKDGFIENLKTYKYRKEVKLLARLPEEALSKITAAAYAFVYPAMYDGLGLYCLQAMQCGVPVIASNTSTLPETAGGAALYADPAIFEDIADKMMQLFKDEKKRSELIERGTLQIQKKYSDKMSDQWWNSMCNQLLSIK